MPKSLKVSQQYITKVKHALHRNGFGRQIDLAVDLELCTDTIRKFCNGYPVSCNNFMEICHRLALDVKDIADFGEEPESQGAVPIGTVRSTEDGKSALDAQLYVERPPIEADCYQGILQPGALIRIKAPKQMGKTWLMDKILHQAASQGYQAVPLNLLQAEQGVMAHLDKFLRWLCTRVSRRLRLPNQIVDYWDEGIGSNDNCTAYFEEAILAKIDSPLVLGLDNVDQVFGYREVAPDFFRLLRSWYEDARILEVWQKLRLVVAHSTEAYKSLDINHSPFNVGLPIELPEFTGDG
ncbi:MAG: hypothetical protein F6K47_02675 [Symploca sp. SIO2E6]|nr:hypothetical protein [Symploca sp. SIO2E6]